MPHDATPKPPREPHTSIGASITVAECKRLHAIAEARQISLTRLVLDALRQTYPNDTTK